MMAAHPDRRAHFRNPIGITLPDRETGNALQAEDHDCSDQARVNHLSVTLVESDRDLAIFSHLDRTVGD